jgi:hypothetical protein
LPESAEAIDPLILGDLAHPIRRHTTERNSTHGLHHTRRVLRRQRRVPPTLVLSESPQDVRIRSLQHGPHPLLLLVLTALLLNVVVYLKRRDPVLRRFFGSRVVRAVGEAVVPVFVQAASIGILVVIVTDGRDWLIVLRRVIGIRLRIASVCAVCDECNTDWYKAIEMRN